MNKIDKLTKYFGRLICLSATTILLVACSNGSSSSSVAPASGQLTFSPSGTIQVTNGSIRHIKFSLENSSGVTAQVVNLTTSDISVASVTPASCTVSSGSIAESSCLVTIHGLKNGNVSISAASSAYPTVTIKSQVGADPVYGNIKIFGQGESSSYTALYPQLESAPHKIYITAMLESSSGVSGDSPLYVNVPTSPNPCSGSACTFGFVAGVDTPQCALSTANPTCNIQGTLYSNTNVSTALNPVGALNANYSKIPVNIVGTLSPESGVITLGSQHNSNGNNTIFSGLNAPLFVNWSGFNGVSESLTLTLTSNSNNLKFYKYNPGAAATTSSSATCTILPSAPNCGLGIIASSNGAYQVSATVTVNPGSATNAIPKLLNSPLTLTVVSPSTTGRTITFTNSSSDKVLLGLTSGSAMSFISPSQSTSGGSFNERQAPGSGSMCGPSNPQSACPIGASCAQGGAFPSESSTYFCFWSPLTVKTGTNPLGSGQTATVFISNSSGITSGTQQIQWSGNYHVDKCPAGVCPPLESSVGTGPTYPAVTLAEVTYQYNPVDYYDVSIINGVNYALTFGPTESLLISSSDAYSCGQAGSFDAQNGGWSLTNQTTAGLPASSWEFTPRESSIVGTIAVGDTPSSYFAVVESAGANYGTCNTNGTGCDVGATCGWEYSKVATGTYAFESSQRICGKFVSWAPANQIFGWNESSTNLAPFNFATAFAVSPAYQGVSSISVGNYQLCNNNTYSSYGTQPINPNGGAVVTPVMACGGINWNSTSYGITRPTGQAVTPNANWMSQALPTIVWLKQACPTCYTFPYDDFASTFTCSNSSKGSQNSTNYTITIKNLAGAVAN